MTIHSVVYTQCETLTDLAQNNDQASGGSTEIPQVTLY